MKRIVIDLIMAAGLAISMLLSGFKGFAEDCEGVRSGVLRLHIPANSDSGYDQRIKLGLRDVILSEYGERLSASESLEEAKAATEALLPEIERTCCNFLKEQGAPYSAKAELTDMYFTTRVYENVTLPAGTYTALRITLGTGEGKNWWCVMFPPLCVPTAQEHREQNEKALPQTLFHDEKETEVEFKFAVFEFFKWITG